MRGDPVGDALDARAEVGPRQRAPDREPHARAACRTRRGSRTPTPAQSTRAAFSAMSPPAGQTHDRAAARQRAHQRPVAAVGRRRGRRPASSASRTATARARRSPARRPAAPARARCRSRSRAPARRARPASAARSSRCERILRRRRRDQHDRAGARRRRRRARPAGSHSSGPTTAQPRRPRARVLELRQRRRPASASARARCGRHGSGASPSRARQSLYSRAPLLEPERDQRVGRAATARARPPSAAAAPRSSTAGTPARRSGIHVRDERRHRHALELRGQRRRGREDVRHRDVRRERPHERHASPRAARTAASYGFSGRSRVGNTWYSGAAANVHPRRGRVGLASAATSAIATSCPRATSAVPEREHRERVPGVAERAEEDLQEVSSATSRSCSRRSSNVHAIGETISVPTPASR